jgi:hypothetical protein
MNMGETPVPDYISEEHWLLKMAISLFEEGDYAEAGILFGQVAALDGELAKEARKYLKLIDERTEPEGEAHQEPVSDENKTRFSPFANAASDSQSSSRTLIRRTPHLDIEPPLPVTPGSTIHVAVYVDESAARDDEDVEEIILESSSDIKFVSVEVHLLVTRHYIIEDDANVSALIIHTDKARSNPARFILKVRSTEDLFEADLLEQPSGITALFFHRGRPCGSVSVNPEITTWVTDELSAMTV